MFLIDDLLMAPVHGFQFILNQIREVVEKELANEETIKQQLLELQMQRERGLVSEEEFAESEAELFERLKAARARQSDLLQQIHTAGGSSLVIETTGLDEEKADRSPGAAAERR